MGLDLCLSRWPIPPGEGTILAVTMCPVAGFQASYGEGQWLCSWRMELVTIRGVHFASGKSTWAAVSPTFQLASFLSSLSAISSEMSSAPELHQFLPAILS